MYFSKNMRKKLIKMIESKQYKIYELKLCVGVFIEDEDELKNIINKMFAAWRKIVCSRSRGYISHFDGILRRLFFEYSEAQNAFNPYFHLICVKKQDELSEDEEYKIRLDEEILRLTTYIKWLSAWVTALKMCTDVSVGFSVLDLEMLEKSLSKFCTNEKYSALAILDEARKEILKRACGTHRLVSFHGIFSEKYMNRHVSVER